MQLQSSNLFLEGYKKLECQSGHFFLLLRTLTLNILTTRFNSFICINEPLRGHVFNEKLLCATPNHILICNITSFKEESSVCVHICLFSYQFQFCATISGSKTKMCSFYSNLGPKLNAEYFCNIIMNRNMKY